MPLVAYLVSIVDRWSEGKTPDAWLFAAPEGGPAAGVKLGASSRRVLGHATAAMTMDLYGNSRELHQTGEKPQGAMSGRGSYGLLKTFGMAA